MCGGASVRWTTGSVAVRGFERSSGFGLASCAGCHVNGAGVIDRSGGVRKCATACPTITLLPAAFLATTGPRGTRTEWLYTLNGDAPASTTAASTSNAAATAARTRMPLRVRTNFGICLI
jgi:hypothetical protein